MAPIMIRLSSTFAAVNYAMKHGAIPASILTPALLADLLERGWTQPAPTKEPSFSLTLQGKTESACLL